MATLNNILAGMQTALTTGEDALFSTSSCFFAFDPKATLQYAPTDQYTVIQPNGIKVKDRTFQNPKPIIPFLVSWESTLWVMVRLGTDEAMRDTLYLQDTVYGSVQLVESIINLFKSYRVTDSPGTNTYSYQLDEVEWQTEKRDNKGWACTRMKFHSDLINH